MVNLELTEAELVFLQRLIGHHFTCKGAPAKLYPKIADKTDKLGITNDSPLNLVDVDSWYAAQGENWLVLEAEG